MSKLDLNRLCGYKIDIKRDGGDRFSYETISYVKNVDKERVDNNEEALEDKKKMVDDKIAAARERFLARKK